MKDFKNQVAVVTGASSGIGESIVRILAKNRARVVLAARRQERLSTIVEDLRANNTEVIAVPTDVRDRAQAGSLIDAAVTQFGKLDMLICCAGIYYRRPTYELTLEEVQNLMEVNFYGVLNCVFSALPKLQKQGRGHIAVISSVEGRKGLPPDGAYIASKFAISGFCDVMRQELKELGIGVTIVFPGRVDTDMVKNISVPGVSPKIPPERVARATIHVIHRNRARVVVPWLGPSLLLLLDFFSARFGDAMVRKMGLSGSMKE